MKALPAGLKNFCSSIIVASGSNYYDNLTFNLDQRVGLDNGIAGVIKELKDFVGNSDFNNSIEFLLKKINESAIRYMGITNYL